MFLQYHGADGMGPLRVARALKDHKPDLHLPFDWLAAGLTINRDRQ